MASDATGPVTDVEGNYRLSVPEDAEALVLSSIGYDWRQ